MGPPGGGRRVDLTGVERLDIEVGIAGLPFTKTMPDVHFDAADQALFFFCESELARTCLNQTVVTKLWLVREEGTDLLGQFVVDTVSG